MTQNAPKPWMSLIPEAEFATYRAGGFMSALPTGSRMALIVIDVTKGFCGSPGLTLEQAIAEYPTACGPAAWEAMPRITALIDLFRARQLPIIYTLSDTPGVVHAGRATKSKRATAMPASANEFPPEINPRPEEWVLGKCKASAFFGTPLTIHLTRAGIDTLVFCGVSTSGCVRASVVDGFSHGYSTIVIDDCCFDRSAFAHAANLFDMSAKYAHVLSLADLPALLPATRAAAE